MSKRSILFGIFVAIIVIAAPKAWASDPVQIGEYGDWVAYKFEEDGNKVCYMAAQPQKAEGNYTSRGDIFALITHRPAQGTKNVFSYITGYPYKSGSDVTLNVDSKEYNLFTENETAWAPDAATDNRLADSIRKGSKMVVKGTSKRGTLTTDTFGLKGSSAAHDAISKECGI